jgi:hypothetical protein
VSWPFIALLACAVVVVIAAEWQRLGGRVMSGRFGSEARRTRERQRRKSSLKLVRSETEEFEQSVQRDLAELPTTKERDRR